MRTRPFLALAALAALVLAGCGDRRLLVGVDALSFTSAEQRAIAFGPVPALPVPVTTGELCVLDDLDVSLFGGASDVVDVQAVTIAVSADVTDSTGSGLDTLRLYLSDAQTSPQSTTPVLEIPVTLTPGDTIPIRAVVNGDARVQSLFAQDKIRLSLTTALRGPATGQALNGRVVLTQLRADVVARHHTL